jgi:CheY-like chemotaxis protein
VISKYFTHLGYSKQQITIVGNGELAYQTWKQSVINTQYLLLHDIDWQTYISCMYHVIFMDLQMPVMDGIESTHQIRNDHEYKSQVLTQPYIIALTANAMEGDKKKCVTAGMDDYLSKPLNMKLFISSLHNAHEFILKKFHQSTQCTSNSANDVTMDSPLYLDRSRSAPQSLDYQNVRFPPIQNKKK